MVKKKKDMRKLERDLKKLESYPIFELLANLNRYERIWFSICRKKTENYYKSW